MDKFKRPWRVLVESYGDAFPDTEPEDYCNGIVDADGDHVIQTDSGCYPPDLETAQLIVDAVNAWKC